MADSPLPEWGTPFSRLMGIAHPDYPWHTPETRAEYEWPTGRWWVARFGDSVPDWNDERMTGLPLSEQERIKAAAR